MPAHTITLWQSCSYYQIVKRAEGICMDYEALNSVLSINWSYVMPCSSTGSHCNQRWECSHTAISISTATCKWTIHALFCSL